MSKVIAIGYSDLHFHLWKQHNENNRRLKQGTEALAVIADACTEFGVPAVFCGDLYHADKAVPTEVVIEAQSAYREFFEMNGIMHYGISGNHDQSQRNNYNHISPNHLQVYDHLFHTFKLIDYTAEETDTMLLCGIPYNNGNVDFKKFVSKFRKIKTSKMKILMLHTDLPNAVDTTGICLETHENIGRDYKTIFKGFDLVISGHIHKAQQLASNVYMLGAMSQQRKSDMGHEMGYWKIYDDATMEFVPTTFAEFKYKTTEKDPDDFHYYLPKPKKYEKPIGEEEEEDFTTVNKPVMLGKSYLKQHGVKEKLKRKALLNSLKDG